METLQSPMRPEIPKNRPLSFKGRRNSNGITLMEVVATMAFLSIGLLGLIPMAVTALKHSNSVENRTIATTLARSKIDALKRTALTTAPLTNLNNDTENIDANGDPGGIFTRVVTITCPPATPSSCAVLLTTIDVTVTWTDYRTNTITQTTLLRQPSG